jgi:hippurate hydrolase
LATGIRSFSPDVEARLEQELPELVRGIAQAYQLTAHVTFQRKLPATINDPEHADFWASTARNVFGEDHFETMLYPKAGSEDFSRILMKIPGSFGHLGAGSPHIDPTDWSPIHSAKAVFDDSVLCASRS